MTRFSKTSIDKLGERLRAGAASDEDLRQLDEYRQAFHPVYAAAQDRIHDRLGMTAAGRAAKSTPAIIHKLRRTQTRHVRLSQIQDIAGLRLIVRDLEEQNATTRRLLEIFPDADVDDRRENPSHGYRAVHVIARLDDLRIEIQVRTRLQHMWAQFCENLADKLGIEVKYGGNEPVQKLLRTFSETIRNLEDAASGLVRETPGTDLRTRDDFVRSFRRLISFVERGPDSAPRKEHDALPD